MRYLYAINTKSVNKGSIMKKIFRLLGTVLSLAAVTTCLYACNNPSDEAAEAVLDMAEQEDKAQEALDAFKADGNAKDAEFEQILEGVE